MKILYLKGASEKRIRMQLRPNEILRNFLSRIDAMCAVHLKKCHIKKQDSEVLALVMKVLPNELKYHLSLLENREMG